MRLRAILAVLIVTSPLTLCSPASNKNAEAEKIINQFFQTYKNTGHKEALVALLALNKWITNEDVNKLVSQIDEMAVQIGKYYGYEKIGESTYGPSVIQYIYLANYERQPLKFIFRFYKANDHWEFQSFNYEIDFMKELDEAGKAYRLEENNNH